MYRKFVGLISFILLLGLAGSTFGAQAYTWDAGAAPDYNWFGVNNWDPNGVPGVTTGAAGDSVTIGDITRDIRDPCWPVLRADLNFPLASLSVSRSILEASLEPKLTIVSGNLAVQDYSMIGSGGSDPCIAGHLIIQGGTFRPAKLWIGYKSLGYLTMTGGSIICTPSETTPENWFEIARGDDSGFLRYGDCRVHLDGGLIDCGMFFMRLTVRNVGGEVYYEESPNGWMDIRGGTLIVGGGNWWGDWRDPIQTYHDPCGWLTAYGVGDMNTGSIVTPEKARLITDYDWRNPGRTTVTAYLAGPGEAYDLNSMPYAVNVDPKVTLTWKPGDYVKYGGLYHGEPNARTGNGHHVFIHTKLDASWNLYYEVGTKYGHLVGAQDANSFDVTSAEANLPGRALKLDTIYYWCVIEANDVCVPQWTYKSLVQSFRTLGGKASSPNPGTGSEVGLYIGEPCDLLLSWNRGFYAATENGHKVYFGTDYNEVNDVDTQYQTTKTDPNWLATGLELGKTYYWRIDEVNADGPDPNWWKGDTWSFKVGKYRVVDAFDSDGSDDDLRARWKDNYLDGSACALWGTGEELYSTTSGQSGRGMRFEYDNNDRVCVDVPCGYSYFSEGRLEYASGKNWTHGDGSTTLKTLALSYQGNANNQVNGADPDLDKMYVAVESTDGKMAIVWNEDPNTQQKTAWQEWNIALSDFNEANDVNVASVKYLYIGFGVRCDPESGVRGLPGGEGEVVFDNIRLYPKRCVGLPGYRMLGDLGGGATSGVGDCDVNMTDVKVLVGNWLTVDRLSEVRQAVADNDANLMARWTFEGDCNNDLVNSKVKAAANGKMYGTPSIVYDAVRDSNVLYLDQAGDVNDYVLCGTWGQDGNFLGKSFTLMCWANQTELSTENDGWADMVTRGEGIQKLEYGSVPWLARRVHFVAHGGGVATSASALDLGKWYHIVGTFQQLADASGGYDRVYVNGRLDVSNAPNSRPYEDVNEVVYRHWGNSTVYDPNWCIGAQDDEGNNLANPPAPPGVRRPFHGYLDDVRVYDRRLTEEEIMYITGYYGPTVKNYYPIADPNIYSDIYSPEAPGSKKINFADLAKLAQDWMRLDVWWPED